VTEGSLLCLRRFYRRLAGCWVGFGHWQSKQRDLFEAEYRFGYLIIGICRVCLTKRIQDLHGMLKMIEERLGERINALSGTRTTSVEIKGSRGGKADSDANVRSA